MNYQLCIILGLIAAIILTIVTYVLIIPASKNGNLNKFCQFYTISLISKNLS